MWCVGERPSSGLKGDKFQVAHFPSGLGFRVFLEAVKAVPQSRSEARQTWSTVTRLAGMLVLRVFQPPRSTINVDLHKSPCERDRFLSQARDGRREVYYWLDLLPRNRETACRAEFRLGPGTRKIAVDLNEKIEKR